MKRTNYFISAILFFACTLLTFSSCSGEDVPPVEEKPVPTFDLQTPSEMVFTTGMTTGTITLKSNMQWSAKSDQEWCKLSPESGKGDVNIGVTLDTNTIPKDRSATVTIVTEGEPISASATRATSDPKTRGDAHPSIKVTIRQSAVPMTKVTFKNVSNNAGKIELAYASGVTSQTVLADDKTADIPSLGMLTAAKFYHKGDNKTVVDWFNSQAGVEVKAPVIIDLDLFAGGTGMPADPYLIANPHHLYFLNKEYIVARENKYYKQINDINLTDACGIYPKIDMTGFDDSKNNPNAPFYNNGQGWRSIGSEWSSLKIPLYYDGNNFKIIGLRINGKEFEGALFYATSGYLKNLTLDETSLIVSKYGSAGFAMHGRNPANEQPVILENLKNNARIYGKKATGICLNIESAEVKGCINNGAITAKDDHVSGIIGFYDIGKTLKISDCVNNGDLKINSGYVGGIIAASGNLAHIENITISNCANNANLSLTVNDEVYLGGIISGIKSSSATIQNCTNKGDIVINTNGNGNINIYAGGIFQHARNAEIKNCKNTGNIKSQSGNLGGFGTELKHNAKVSDCINEGTITAINGNAAGIITSNDQGTITNCTNKAGITAANLVAGVVGINNSIVNNCSNSGNITCTYDNSPIPGHTINPPTAGGIISFCTTGASNCKNSGNVKGGVLTGGIVGDAWAGVFSGNSNAGNITGLNCIHVTGTNNESWWEHRYAGYIFGYTRRWGSQVQANNNTNTGKLSGGHLNKYPEVIYKDDVYPEYVFEH